MRLAIIVVLVSAGCDIASRQKKLPELPQPPAAETEPEDPAAWTAAGDRACPAIDTGQSLPGGPPGSTVRQGRITRDPRTGRLACQVIGHDHGPATEPDGRGGTATGVYTMGKRTGEWIGRHADGRLAWTGSYAGGIESGQWAYWSPSGALQSTGAVAGKARIGMWSYWSGQPHPGDPPERFELYDKKQVVRGVVIDGEPVVTHAVCSVGMSAPRCQLILASGVGFRVGPASSDSPIDESRWSGVLDADLIANVGARHGIGLGGGIYFDDVFARTGVRVSYRYWTTYWLATEVAAGLVFPRSDLEVRGNRGQTARLTLNVADQGALGLELQRHDDGSGPELVPHLFLKVGVIPIVVAAATALRIGAAAK